MNYKRMVVLIFMLFMIGMFPYTEVFCVSSSKFQGFKFSYQVVGPNAVQITDIKPIRNNDVRVLVIPSKIDGKKVIALGKLGDDGETQSPNIFGLSISEDDDTLGPASSIKWERKIKKIVLPNTIKEITSCCFNYVHKGKSINIPVEVTENLAQFLDGRWKNVSLSKNSAKYMEKFGLALSKDGKVLYGLTKSKKVVNVPEGVTKIESGVSFNNVSQVYLPSSIDSISRNAFETKKKVSVVIAKTNPHYGVAKSCIYSKKTGRLVVGTVINNTLTIPKKVSNLKNTALMGSYSLKSIIVPKSVKKINNFWIGYNGKKIKMIFRGKVPPKMNVGFAGQYRKIVIQVPKGCKKIYRKVFKDNKIDCGNITIMDTK